MHGDETEARIEPFDVIPLDVASWWPPAGSVEGEPAAEPGEADPPA